MKNLTLLNDNTNIKLNDTGTVIQFKASNEGQPVGLSNGQSAVFRIKNELGFLKSVTANTTYGGYVFELDTEDLKGLVPDTYQVELLIQVDSENDLIFPDKGFVQFSINANALNITGEQLPVMSLEDFKDELKTYVDNQTTQATTNIKNDFDTYVDNLTDSTITTATKASQDATNAINTANTAKSTADTAKSTADIAKSTADSATVKANNAQSTADTANNKATANASLITANNTLIQTNTNSINNGLYLDMAKSLTQANTSKNLIINSSMQTKQEGIHPYSDWQCIWGWVYSNGNLAGRKNWYGHEAIQANQITNSVALLSQGVYAGTVRSSTIYSAKVHYRKYGALTDTTYTFYLEYAYQNDFQNSQKIEIGNVNKDSNDDNWIIKENMTVPEGYNWLRLRVEASTEKPEAYLFIGSPMLNYGSTVLDYIPSNQSGQRIAEIESNLATVVQQTMQSGTDLNSVKNTGNWELKGVTLTNTPVSSTLWGILSVTSINNGTNGSQLLTDTNTNKMYRRCWNSSNNFTSWVEM